MNKTAIKNFAIWARNKLRADIKLKMGLLGITEDAISQPLPQSTADLQLFDIGTSQPVKVEGTTAISQRNSLVSHINSKHLPYKEAFDAVVEEVAYTWFNRLIAIRFMEVNDYLPSRVRVLSSENKEKAEPDFVTNPFETDLEFTDEEVDLIDNLIDNNKSDELFQFLFIKQCNKLHEVLPILFEKTNDYTELLLNVSFTDNDGVVYHLVHDIDEDDFNIEKQGQVEIIGWLYQYYNTEPKDTVFVNLKKNKKITKETIPAATQLFTPDWIVRYMVENSLGRLYVSNQCNNETFTESELVAKEKEVAESVGWKYFLPEAEQTPEVRASIPQTKFNLSDTKFLDPCMGSGHILVYAFDVFMDIYRMQGYSDRDAAQNIVQNNIFGLEIDDRATQLAYFAIMMKARSYDRKFLTRGIRPNIFAIQESNDFNSDYLELFENKSLAEKFVESFKNAKTYGSILNLDFTMQEIETLENEYNEINNTNYDNIFDTSRQAGIRTLFADFLNQAKVMVNKYDVVCTNPPYMGASGMDNILGEYVKKNYPDSKSDLFAVFIEKCLAYTKKYSAMITQHAWMFLSSYEQLRVMLNSKTIVNMAHLGAKAFDEIGGEVVQTTSFILQKQVIHNYKATYCRLIDPTTENGKKEMYLANKNRYIANQENFSKIPGSPVAYWASNGVLKAFETGVPLGKLAVARNGMKTGKNEKFVRFWHEVDFKKCKLDAKTLAEALQSKAKFFPYNKGGEYRKWYGNNDCVVNWENQGREIFDNAKADGRNVQNYPDDMKFSPSVTWSLITSGGTSFRYKDNSISDIAGMSLYNGKEKTLYYLALCNTKICASMLSMIAPTLNSQAGDISRIPVVFDTSEKIVLQLSDNNIRISKCDWDSFETSWDFKRHPIAPLAFEKREQEQSQFAQSRMEKFGRIEWHYEHWVQECEARFNQLKSNEEELNRIFIDIYGLGDELTPEVEDKDVTVRKADLQRDIKSLISYAVGCMFGRYSLDREGLVFAGGNFDDTYYLDAVFPSNDLYPSNNLYPKEPRYTKLITDEGLIDLSFEPDYDNCIPITDTPYFEDDIVGRFVEFIKVVYGEETLEENLDFIASALSNKGNTSREIIRNYFLNDFYKDHCKTYQKRPIYWLFDSGKQNGFKALVYMHRWNADTVGNIRVDYLHRVQRTYEKEIEREQDTIDNSTNNREISVATKRKEKLLKQLKETKDYDALVAHIALTRPDIDLDDGVKVNYEKVQTAQDGKKLQILAKI